MISYICDTSFEGLLTAIYFAYKEESPCRVLSGDTYQTSLDDTPVYVDTDFELYGKMESYISSRCGVECLMSMYKAYLGELPGISGQIFDFFKIALVKKLETQYMHAHPKVMPVLKEERRVARESQKMLGFIRFKKISEELLYAGYTPSSNVTPLVARHFTDRMNSYNWIIHDTSRDVFAVFNKKECVIGHSVPANLPVIRDIDADYEELWKSYTVHVAIKERRNLRLQMNLMPKKYWHFLTEKKI